MIIRKFDSLLIIALGLIISDSYDTDDFWLTMCRYAPVISCILGSIVMTYLTALNNYESLKDEKHKDEKIKLTLEKLEKENNELKEENNELKEIKSRFFQFQNKVDRKKWVKNLRQEIYDLRKWKDDIISNPIKDEEINYFRKTIDLGWYRNREELNFLQKICIKIIFLFDETEKLKQELVNQTANNIILKDELNKLKETNN